MQDKSRIIIIFCSQTNELPMLILECVCEDFDLMHKTIVNHVQKSLISFSYLYHTIAFQDSIVYVKDFSGFFRFIELEKNVQ